MQVHQPAALIRAEYPPCGCGRCARCRYARACAPVHGLLGKSIAGMRAFLVDPSFWLGVSLSFPLEHFFWEKLWPMRLLTRFLGL